MIEAPIRGLAYMAAGITCEVFFTAIKALILKKDYTLHGFTQLWVTPLYFFGGVCLFEPLHFMIMDYHVVLRFCIYAVSILSIEYLAGFTVKRIIGKCPWEYTNRSNVHGYISIAHFPFWGSLALGAEFFHNYLISF